MPGEPSHFTQTIWSDIEAGARGCRDAATRVYLRYRRPVFLFLQAHAPRRRADLDPELLADGILTTVLEPSFLAEAEPSKGRFRDLLFAVARNTLRNALKKAKAKKHGGGRHHVSLDEVRDAAPAARHERRDFALFYAREVIAGAVQRLKAERRGEGLIYAEVLKLHYERGLSYPEIAKALARSRQAVTSLLHKARKQLRGYIIAELADVSRTLDEGQDEARLLLGILDRQHRRR